jgi:predicted dehydrogenase
MSHKIAFLGGSLDSAVGRAHKSAIEIDKMFSLVAGCFSRNMEINLKTGIEYGVQVDRIYTTFIDLINAEKDNLDAIVILTPTDSHYNDIITCVEAKIPVICEKSMVTSSAESKKIHDLCETTNSFLAVTYNYTGYPMIRELQNLISSGKLGEIKNICIEMPQEGFLKVDKMGKPIVPQNWRLKDGNIPTLSLDLGVHVHSIINFLIGKKPLEVVASVNTFGNFKSVVDDISCIVNYSDGINVNMWFSKSALGYRNGLKVRVFGDKGAAEWIQENPEYLYFSENNGTKTIIDRSNSFVEIASESRYSRFKPGHPAGFIEAFANYYYDISESLDKFKSGEKEILNHFTFGTNIAHEGMQLLEAITRSKENKKWESVYE